MHTHTHTGAYGVIRNKNKVALVLKGRGAYVGQWDLPGGKIEVGENPESALVREIQEETGLETDDYHLIGVFSNRTVHSHTPDHSEQELFHVGLVYSVHVESRNRIRSCFKEDTLGARWFSLDEIRQLPLTPFAEKCAFIM